MKLKAYKVVEEKTSIAGVSFIEFLICSMGTLLLLMIFTTAGNAGLPISRWLYLVTLVVGVGCFFLLRYLNKSSHPEFLLSWVNYTRQPKKYVNRKAENERNLLYGVEPNKEEDTSSSGDE